MGTHPIFESDFDCLTVLRMSEITTEIAGKLRLSIKKQLENLGCKDLAGDDDLLEYMMVIFGQKKRFKDICESIEPFLEAKTKKMASWLDDLIRKVNLLPVDAENEAYQEAERKAQANTQEISSESEHEFTRSRSRSRSNERQKINIFLDDARELHDIEDDKNQIQRRMKRMHANVSRLIISKQTKTAKKEFLGINEELERILERCDGVQLDPKDENNRKHRKKLIKDTQKLLDRNDKGIGSLINNFVGL